MEKDKYTKEDLLLKSVLAGSLPHLEQSAFLRILDVLKNPVTKPKPSRYVLWQTVFSHYRILVPVFITLFFIGGGIFAKYKHDNSPLGISDILSDSMVEEKADDAFVTVNDRDIEDIILTDYGLPDKII